MIKGILEKNIGLAALCALFFAVGIPLGYLFFEQTQNILMPVLEELKDLATRETKLETAEYIFLNNYKVCLYLLLAGTLILPTFLMMLANGFVIGFVAKLIENKDLGLIFFMKGITAHGVFELPAIFISAAMGLRIGIAFLTPDKGRFLQEALILSSAIFGMLAAAALGAYTTWTSPAVILLLAFSALMLVLYARNEKRRKMLHQSIREAALIHFAVVIPLLVIAAFVEVFVSAVLVAQG